MSVAADVPDELSGPVGYDGPWVLLAVAGLVVVALYYAVVLWRTRDRGDGAGPGRRGRSRDVPTARRTHLERIDRVEADVAAGRLTPRQGHQQLSGLVRSYAGTVSSLPAPTMALADLRQRAPAELAGAVELMYPPEFAPDDVGEARERFAEALRRARRLVTSWS